MGSKNDKIVNINIDLLKDKITEVKDSAFSKLKKQRNSAVSGILGKTIEISKKQLDALQNAKKNFD